jgi:hypothetical protein
LINIADAFGTLQTAENDNVSDLGDSIIPETQTQSNRRKTILQSQQMKPSRSVFAETLDEETDRLLQIIFKSPKGILADDVLKAAFPNREAFDEFLAFLETRNLRNHPIARAVIQQFESRKYGQAILAVNPAEVSRPISLTHFVQMDRSEQNIQGQRRKNAAERKRRR